MGASFLQFPVFNLSLVCTNIRPSGPSLVPLGDMARETLAQISQTRLSWRGNITGRSVAQELTGFIVRHHPACTVPQV